MFLLFPQSTGDPTNRIFLRKQGQVSLLDFFGFVQLYSNQVFREQEQFSAFKKVGVGVID